MHPARLLHDLLGGDRGHARVLVYRGYGTAERVWVRGRVIHGRGIHPLRGEVSSWGTLRQMLRRFLAYPLEGERLLVRFAGAEREVVTDELGEFKVELTPRGPIDPGRCWHPVEVHRLRSGTSEEAGLRAYGQLLIPGERARFLVISDMDDTVVHTHATDKLRMLRIVLLKSAGLRTPFCGVCEFYEALRRGVSGEEDNPIFYVSSSSWAIHDVFEDFLDEKGLPPGPMMLRSMRLRLSDLFARDRHDHKIERISEVARAYPDLPLVLIGDSGQRDAWLYEQVTERFPGRVRLIYLRDVTNDPAREHEIHELARVVASRDCDLRLVAHTAQAADHAASLGWIAPDAVEVVQAAVAEDAPEDAVESLVSDCKR